MTAPVWLCPKCDFVTREPLHHLRHTAESGRECDGELERAYAFRVAPPPEEEMTTALKQIADLTGELVLDARPGCGCRLCRIHRIAVTRRGEL